MKKVVEESKMTIEYTSFNYKDADQIVHLWNETMPYDKITKEKFVERVILDVNFDADLALVAKDKEKVIGFLLGIKRKYPYLTRGLEEDRGWISIQFVHWKYQAQGIGGELLGLIEKKFKDLEVKEITLCAYSPNYFTPGIDLRYRKALSFFEKNGYQFGSEAVSMKRELWDYELPREIKEKVKNLEEEGIQFKGYKEEYMQELMSFTEKEFGGGWLGNVRNAILKQEAEETILLCLQNEKVIGFAMRKIDGNDGRFGPIGIDHHFRSKGLGGILLELMMQEMKKRDIYSLYFLWTSGSAQCFYERHQFEVFRTYRLYKKELMK